MSLLVTLCMSCAVVMAPEVETSSDQVLRVDSDTLVAHIDQYLGTEVEVEGLIVHVCSVDGKKMKMKGDKGAIVKVVPVEPLTQFDASLLKQRVIVRGTADENRIPAATVDRLEQEGTLLCHIDHTPCKDTEWVKRQVESGAAEGLVKKDIEKLRKQMQDADTSYVSVVTVRAISVTVQQPE
jgi:hypothetical protein